MIDIPEVDSKPPDDELSAKALHDRWEQATTLSASQLRQFKDSQFNEAYLEQNSSKAQDGNKPLNDAIQLAETPADDWSDADDGFNEVKQAQEALDFLGRAGAQAEDGLGDNYLTESETMQKREAALIRWGLDPDDEREWL